MEACDGKLILVGDPNQLPSIDSGGLFHRIVTDRHGVIDNLADSNHRQQRVIDRHALHQLRTGDTERAVFDYVEAGRLHLGDDRTATMTAMVDAWWTDLTTTPLAGVRMLAARRLDVEILNQLARTRMHATGQLTGPEYETRSGRTFQVGERVILKQNWYAHHDVRNGQTATITAINPDRRTVTVCRDHDRAVFELPGRYVDTSVDYGYAQTIHTAQGHTYHRSHLYIDDSISSEHGYAGLSRARDETHLWITTTSSIGDCHHATRTPDPIADLIRQLDRTTVEPPAVQPNADVRQVSDRQLNDWRRQLGARIASSPLAHNPEDQIVQLDAALSDARRNSTHATGALRQIKHLEQLRIELTGRLGERAAWIDNNRVLLDRYLAVTTEAHRRIAARVASYHLNPPPELTNLLGPRPTEPARQAVWDHAAHTHATARFWTGPDVDLTDPRVAATGPWRDLTRTLHQAQEPAPIPTLRIGA